MALVAMMGGEATLAEVIRISTHTHLKNVKTGRGAGIIRSYVASLRVHRICFMRYNHSYQQKKNVFETVRMYYVWK